MADRELKTNSVKLLIRLMLIFTFSSYKEKKKRLRFFRKQQHLIAHMSLSKDHNKVTTLKFKVSLRSGAFALSTFPFDLVKRVSGPNRFRTVRTAGRRLGIQRRSDFSQNKACRLCMHQTSLTLDRVVVFLSLSLGR